MEWGGVGGAELVERERRFVRLYLSEVLVEWRGGRRGRTLPSTRAAFRARGESSIRSSSSFESSGSGMKPGLLCATSPEVNCLYLR